MPKRSLFPYGEDQDCQAPFIHKGLQAVIDKSFRIQVLSVLILISILVSLLGCSPKGHPIKIQFDRIKGLQKEAPVFYDNTLIGRVTRISLLNNGKYLVDISVEKSFVHAATEFSKFYITTPSDAETNMKEPVAVSIELTQPGGKILPAGTTVTGSVKEPPSFATHLESRIQEGLDYLQQQFGDVVEEINKLTAELQQIPESKEVERLKTALDSLVEEMKNAGQAAKDKIKKEYLPRLRQELDKLRDRLHQLGREEEIEPLEVKMKDLREI